MGTYDAQQVCLNGHQITDCYNQYPQHRQSYCGTCGEPTINVCPNCKRSIKGHYHVPGVLTVRSANVPANCDSCGKPFPWTERQAKTIQLTTTSTGGTADAGELLATVCRRFHLVVKQLRSRHENRVTLDVQDEYDVQDLMHSFLKLFFDDVRAEEVVPSYAGKSTRMDFLLKDQSIGIEVKKTRAGLADRDIGTQLIEDIVRYRAHPNCKILICFVYDPDGRIANPQALEKDLSRKDDDLDVRIFIAPRGY